jgi:hypothetical protein
MANSALQIQQLTANILRIGVVGIFAGHGWLAFMQNTKWLVYINTVGVVAPTDALVLKIIGVIDMALALTVLLKPLPAVLLWAAFWAFLTALIRPLSGEAWVEFVERAGNWACPLALYFLVKNKPNNKTV